MKYKLKSELSEYEQTELIRLSTNFVVHYDVWIKEFGSKPKRNRDNSLTALKKFLKENIEPVVEGQDIFNRPWYKIKNPEN